MAPGNFWFPGAFHLPRADPYQKGVLNQMTKHRLLLSRTRKTRKMVMTAMLAAVSVGADVFQLQCAADARLHQDGLLRIAGSDRLLCPGPCLRGGRLPGENLVNPLFHHHRRGGEPSNFLLGSLFVAPAGIVYRKIKGRKGALVAPLIGAAAMAVCSVFSNYYVVYPIYTAFMPMEAILGMYRAINPHVENLVAGSFYGFNMPFTFLKGMYGGHYLLHLQKRFHPSSKDNRRGRYGPDYTETHLQPHPQADHYGNDGRHFGVVLVFPRSIFPSFPSPPYLEYDPADILIFICTFLYGPGPVSCWTVLMSTIQGVIASAASGWIGILMHIFATGSFTLVAGNIYRHGKSKRTAVLALVAGVLTMTGMMVV